MTSGQEQSAVVERQEPECFFCDRLRDPLTLQEWCVYSDDLLVATHEREDEGTSFLGTVLVQTRRHVDGLARLNDTEAQRLGLVLARLSRALVETVGAEWTYAYGFMEGFRHVHLIVDARYPNLPREYVRLGIHEWPAAPRGDAETVRRLTEALRTRMAPPAVPPVGG